MFLCPTLWRVIVGEWLTPGTTYGQRVSSDLRSKSSCFAQSERNSNLIQWPTVLDVIINWLLFSIWCRVAHRFPKCHMWQKTFQQHSQTFPRPCVFTADWLQKLHFCKKPLCRSIVRHFCSNLTPRGVNMWAWKCVILGCPSMTRQCPHCMWQQLSHFYFPLSVLWNSAAVSAESFLLFVHLRICSVDVCQLLFPVRQQNWASWECSENREGLDVWEEV